MTTPTARVAALAALGHRDGPLAIGGVPAHELAERFGTPLFAYDLAVFRARIAEVRAAFGADVRVLFALKANPLLALARTALAAGLGLEVASAGELAIARAAGCAPGAAHCTGPGKSDADLDAALHLGARVNLESEREYARLTARARALAVRPQVAIRVHPGAVAGGPGLRMAAAASRFGVDRARVPALAARIVADGTCELVGLHQHAASQVTDATAWLCALDPLLATAIEVEQATGQRLRSLGLGGGFAWPTHDGDAAFDPCAAGSGARARLAAAGRLGADTEVWIEPGRYLAQACGVYLARVVDAKDSGGRRQVVLDGGMHHFAAAAGIGAPARRCFPIVHAARVDDPHTEPVDLGGPLCTPADRFGRAIPLPRLEFGDLVAVLAAGAYSRSFSPLQFLGHPAPAECVVDGGAARLARDRGAPDEVLRGQHE